MGKSLLRSGSNRHQTVPTLILTTAISERTSIPQEDVKLIKDHKFNGGGTPLVAACITRTATTTLARYHAVAVAPAVNGDNLVAFFLCLVPAFPYHVCATETQSRHSLNIHLYTPHRYL